MDRFVVMVDAGYLLHKSVEMLSNRVTKERRYLELTNPQGLIQLLVEQTRGALGLSQQQLLRAYWYDGVMSDELTTEQRLISDLPDVHFRAGLVNARRRQEGVDSLIVTDLLELASNRAVSDAALVTGDSDLAIAIELAQKKGVRVAVIGLEDLSIGINCGQSKEITNRADRVVRISGASLAPLMRYVARPSAGSNAHRASVGTEKPAGAGGAEEDDSTATEKDSIDAAVRSFIFETSYTGNVVDMQTQRINTSVDRHLMQHVLTSLERRQLSDAARTHARACFRERLGV